jgi:hypothetical protein
MAATHMETLTAEFACDFALALQQHGCTIPNEVLTSAIQETSNKTFGSVSLSTIVALLEGYMQKAHPDYTPRARPAPSLPQILLLQARHIANKSKLDETESADALLGRRAVYKRLEPYFADFEIRDIRTISESDMLTLVKPEDRMVAKLFAKDCLSLLQDKGDTTVLSFPGHFSTHANALDREAIHSSHADPCFDIVAALETAVTASERPEDIRCVNLSDAYLHDADLEGILRAIKNLPKLELVNLASNRHLGVTDDVRGLILGLLTFRGEDGPIVDVTHSRYLLSVDHRELYMTLPCEAFGRFVFLSRSWLTGSEGVDDIFQHLLKDRADYGDTTTKIVNTHKKYYKI